MFFSNHMIWLMWIVHICFMDETIFASPSRSLLNLAP
jgi:hypothetical protein